jgi:hypothetical protein
MNDNATQTTFLLAQAVVMNISISSLTYQSCGNARRLMSNGFSGFKKFVQSGYVLGTKVVVSVPTSSTGNNTDPSQAATNLYNQLSNASPWRRSLKTPTLVMH